MDIWTDLDNFGLNGKLDWLETKHGPQTRKFGLYGTWIPDPKQDSKLENLDLRSGQNTVSTKPKYDFRIQTEEQASWTFYIN